MSSKLSRVIEVSLNGDADKVDPAVRRTLYALGDEIESSLETLSSKVDGVRRLLLGLTTTTIGAMLVGIANILIGL